MKKYLRTNIYHNLGGKFRKLTSTFRYLPDFMIIGATKAGTTSLHAYLQQHPKITSSVSKEPHFFNWRFSQGTTWYQSLFPLKGVNKKLAFDASASYLFHPHAPRRIKEFLPKVKLIVLLRDPVSRSFSEYQMRVRNNTENIKTFEEAIEIEKLRTHQELKKIINDKISYSENVRRFSYLSNSKYIEHIEKWLDYFSKNQFLFIQSEVFFKTPMTVLKEIYEFLEVPDYTPQNLKPLNQFRYPTLNFETENRLTEYFRPYNNRLYKLIGRDFKW